ncbi:uncharacterized protein LOC126819031 [Patella vulgata]|uniref:uncharacterized protein LOC126819031 n=1 Tax=Patella vulgata TaxID=6465 RepID=UPI00217F6BAB|nr:uncharacterized protein LOC126819031 [Patella vulgata]XP_050402797.1 uncharacterized protein LOC126819031 [Patella vulgata]XP_050402799.1 uncharacterized protein LOC126819031 [Patella vulgata]XP_050402800.1 uncharacterized protein LOC126819031 [Patella vulgata]XP_050402801.1 uncharacterized protein LOC126819031 [Patella vulgata]XP_055956385.1 uncharacterized protein LOC126819031 [Patella vulgata]
MMPVMMKPEPRDEPLVQQPVPQPVIQSTASVPTATPLSQINVAATQPHTSSQSSPLQEAVEKDSEEDIENRIDVESIKGVFGWATVDGVNIPYIIRKYKKFVSVRIVEKKLLSRYPNAFPDELAKKDPLVSFFVTEYEAKLLNEINTIHCSFEYGNQAFTTKELIVDLVEFEDFYNLVKKTFPDEVLAKLRSGDEQAPENKSAGSTPSREVLEKVCSWIQINNTVTPVIKRKDMTFVPLSVIKYAAGLLTNVQLDGIQPSPDDCAFLNETCKIAGFDFQFGKSTKLIELSEIARHCQPTILQLPFEDPLKHARYLDTPSPSAQPPSPSTTHHSSPPSQTNVQNPTLPNPQFTYQRPNVPVNPFAMMQMMTRSLVPQQLAYSQPGVMPNAMANQAIMQRMSYNPRLAGGNVNPHPHSPYNQAQQQINNGKLPYPPPPYNPQQGNLPNNPTRREFPQEHMHLQQNQAHNQIYPRQGVPPNQGYPYQAHNPRVLPPNSPPYQSPKPTGRAPVMGSSARSINPEQRPPAAASSKNVDQSFKANIQSANRSNIQPENTIVTSKPSSSNHLKIEGVVLNGKSISCLNLNSTGRQGKFCLVEAVCKLYFSQCNINEFLYVLQKVLNVPLYSCKDEEEKSFIQYYNLPVNVLKCNKMVKLSDLDNFFPHMSYIINQTSSDSASSSSSNRENAGQTANPQSMGGVNLPPEGGTTASRKRASSGQGGPESKQSCKLEQIMQRLAQTRNQTADASASIPGLTD